MTREQCRKHFGAIQSCPAQVFAWKILSRVIQIRRSRAQRLFDDLVSGSDLFSHDAWPPQIFGQPSCRLLIISRSPTPGVGIAEHKDSFCTMSRHSLVPPRFGSAEDRDRFSPESRILCPDEWPGEDADGLRPDSSTARRNRRD